MLYRKRDGYEFIGFPAMLGILVLVMAVKTSATIHSNVWQDKNGKRTAPAQTPNKRKKEPAPRANFENSGSPVAGNDKQKPQTADDEITSAIDTNGDLHASPAKKKLLAISLLDEALANTDKINPVEYGTLVQVEAAAILWEIDKERSVSLLRSAIKSLRDLMDEERQSKEKRIASKNRQTLRSLILRRIAALKPDLLKGLSVVSSSDDKTKDGALAEWTQEAKALIAVAADQIAKDPKLAARLAEQALPLGMVGWATFLNALSQRDAGEAERLATTIINQMHANLVDPSVMVDLKRFILASDRSSELKELFFQSIAAQLRLSIRPDKTPHELTGYLYTARDMLSFATARYPNWQAEFADIVSIIEAIFTERSQPVPGPPLRRIMDTSMMTEAVPGDTQEISKSLSRVDAIKDSKARDREYQRLAAKAGFSTDTPLAESIISKIENENIRRETTVMVYTPMVRKAIAESNWSYAQRLALNLQDPMGRTLLLDQIAEAMAKARENKLEVMDVYRLAIGKLQREETTQQVAKAFLILVKSLLPFDREAGVDAANSAIWVLNKIAKKDDLLEEAPLESVSPLVSSPNLFLNSEDVLVLPELLGKLFKDLAKRNADESVMIADGLAHWGLYSLARLAISKALVEASSSPNVIHRKRAAVKP